MTAPVALLAALLAAAPASAPGPEPGPDDLADDYPAALARARERGVPILVDVWAPWCPPCRYMQGFVMRDPALARITARVVRLEVNTELSTNAAFADRFPIDAWPTLLVIDPGPERVLARWMGSATPAEVVRLVGEGEQALRAGKAGRAEAALARGDQAYAARRHGEAAAAYAEALEAGGRSWARRGLAAEKRVQALSLAGDEAACAEGARQALPLLAPGPRARAAAAGLSCAAGLADAAARRAALGPLEAGARAALSGAGLTADDRSGLHEALVGAREALGDGAGARAEARRWLAFLEGSAARARTPLARSAFDAPRVSAAIQLGEPARALSAVKASVRDLPGDYAPLSTLAYLDLALERPAEALEASGKALALATGPRRVRVLLLRAQAERALGRPGDARATLEEAIRTGESYPEERRPRGWMAEARRLLEGMGAG
jgi:thiol-disulfide isomerase/thioredoxin